MCFFVTFARGREGVTGCSASSPGLGGASPDCGTKPEKHAADHLAAAEEPSLEIARDRLEPAMQRTCLRWGHSARMPEFVRGGQALIASCLLLLSCRRAPVVELVKMDPTPPVLHVLVEKMSRAEVMTHSSRERQRAKPLSSASGGPGGAGAQQVANAFSSAGR